MSRWLSSAVLVSRPDYTRLQRLIEIAGIAVFFALTPFAALKLYAAAAAREINGLPILVAGGFVMALLAADLISGVVHWLADNWGSPTWPVVGPGFVRPFRHHHEDPVEMTRHGFVEMNGNNCIVSLPVFWASDWSLTAMTSSYGMFWGAFWFALAYWVLATNQFHAWAHTKNPPRLVRWLQRARLILPPEHHARHHVAPHNRNYCITTGWLNAPLRWIRFFASIDWTVTKLTGAEPEHHRVARAMQSSYATPPSSPG